MLKQNINFVKITVIVIINLLKLVSELEDLDSNSYDYFNPCKVITTDVP
jgi:hypothetical protein